MSDVDNANVSIYVIFDTTYITNNNNITPKHAREIVFPSCLSIFIIFVDINININTIIEIRILYINIWRVKKVFL